MQSLLHKAHLSSVPHCDHFTHLHQCPFSQLSNSGTPGEDAERFVEHLAKNKEQLIKALARERLNTTEEGLSKPLVSAVSGALSTAVGALIPIIPFFFMAGIPAVIVAAIVSLIAHFAVGAAKSLITIRSWWSSGLEMTIVGAVEGVVTYVIGIGIGKIGGGQ
jgi:vacuolar iron transporter family protein